MSSLRTVRNLLLLALPGVAGYLLAGWLSGPRGPTKLEALCSHAN
jgi:hypothetical protein